MRHLVDAQSLIWALDDPRKLGIRAIAVLEDPANELLVSVGTIWELSIKGPSGVFMGRAVNGRRAGRSHLWSGRVLWSGSYQAFERPRANQSGTVSMRPGYPALALGAS